MNLCKYIQYSKRMIIQVLSDIHLESYPLPFNELINPLGDVLVLAGDIGNPLETTYQTFLKSCAANFKHVIVIAGNHEYRSTKSDYTMMDLDFHMSAIVGQYSNCFYLSHGDNIEINGVNFIGATMWTPIKSPACPKEFQTNLEKYLQTQWFDKQTPWGIYAQNKLHKLHLEVITDKINLGLSKNLKNVIVTHHAPMLTGCFKTQDFPNDYLYGVDLLPYINSSICQAWIFGHTHCNWSGFHKGTFLCSNQRGRVGKAISGWRKDFVFSTG